MVVNRLFQRAMGMSDLPASTSAATKLTFHTKSFTAKFKRISVKIVLYNILARSNSMKIQEHSQAQLIGPSKKLRIVSVS